MPGSDGLLEERLGRVFVRGDPVSNSQVARDAQQRRKSRPLWFRRKRPAVDVQTIEEERSERQLGPELLGVQSPSEPTHRLLERQGCSISTKRDDFAVENQLARREPAGLLDHYRNRVRHVPQRARKHSHIAAALMNLNTRTVELQLKGRLAKG